MYFDQFGNVRACCQNTATLMGNVAEQTIRMIWESAATERMRDALAQDDYSEGCGFCAWQVDQGDHDIVFARAFDKLPIEELPPRWPAQMEFSMTNACNLQCQMCNGDWSSSIRTHREGRAPLPAVYHEDFFAELAEFLPHLRKVNFLGGEPFLGREPLRVMGMLADLDRPPEVAVTTNGTQWSDRIERICERLPMSFVLSLDGITAATYESIRIGAQFEQVMANLDRFRDYARRHGTTVTLAHCLMRSNWTEFSQLLVFAEERGLGVGMNEVLFPVELSLFQLPATELAAVVAAMERDERAAGLSSLRPVWDGQLDALRHRLESLQDGVHTFVRPWSASDGADASWYDDSRYLLTEWSDEYPPPVLVRFTSDGIELGDRATDFLDRLELPADSDPEGLLETLRATFGTGGRISRRYTDLVDDYVVADAEGRTELEFRLTWGRHDGELLGWVAVRNHPALPPDPLGTMTTWAGSGNVVTLVADGNDLVVAADGPLGELGLHEGSVNGRSTADLLGDVVGAFGDPDVLPGPSGYTADALMRFATRGGHAPPPELRVMTDRQERSTVRWIGVRTAAHLRSDDAQPVRKLGAECCD